MTKYVVRGGSPLMGEVTVSGAKNAAVAIIPAALIVDGPCRIENVPRISDVDHYLSIFGVMGANACMKNQTTIEIDCRGVRKSVAPEEMVRKFRASSYLIGAMLGRFGEAHVSLPGGCDFGVRPIDQHIKGFTAMGAEVEVSGGTVHATTKDGLHGAEIYLDVVSVGATINIMIAAARAKGMTVIENAAKEPHIVDLANFLNSMGANISGAGTDIIKIRGVDSMRGGSYSIIPDQIEAGTYLCAVAAAGGRVTINNVIPKHLDCITAKLAEMGVEIDEGDDYVTVSRFERLKRSNIKTMPYPGFPTDMQPQTVACLAIAEGTSIVAEHVFEGRYKYVDELRRMGANIQVDGRLAVVEGAEALKGCAVKACDLRAGAAMVIAALAAEGVSEIEDVHHIERGYENMVEKLRGLGADIERVEDEPMPEGRLAS